MILYHSISTFTHFINESELENYQKIYRYIIIPKKYKEGLFSMPFLDSEYKTYNIDSSNIIFGCGKGILLIWKKIDLNSDFINLLNEKMDKSVNFDGQKIIIITPQKSITIIGWMGPACEGWIYGNWFERWGMDIKFIGTNPDPINHPVKYKLPSRPSYLYNIFHNFDNSLNFIDKIEISRLESYKPLLNRKSDLYICFQPNCYLGFNNIKESVYFCPTEQASRIMIHDVKDMKFVYHYFGADDMYKNAHPEIMKRIPRSNKLFLPHSYLFDGILSRSKIEQLTNKSFTEREIFCGFMGNKGEKGSDSKKSDYICEHTYDDRVKYLESAKNYITFKETQGYHKFDKYIEFLGNCKFGINIGTFSDPNQRTFQIPAAGGILIQKYYPDLIDFGFVNGMNCFTFTDELHLNLLLTNLKNNHNNYDFESIRKKGMKNAADHSSEQNSIRFLKFILEREKSD